MNVMNPDLMWNPASKGYRSSLRRPKKAFARNSLAGAELLNKSTRKMVDKAVSDTEKQGVAVLGGQFSDKYDNAEHIPIKKRRFRSPSPSPQVQTLSPYFQVFESNINGKERCGTSNSCMKTKISEVNYSKYNNSDSLSGIEILADVACSNNMNDVVCNDERGSLIEETTRVDSSASAVLFEENAASLRDPVCEDRTEVSSHMDSEFTLLQKIPSVKDIGSLDAYTPSRACKLHWDLNVPMEAWNLPCDALSADSRENSSVNFMASNEKKDMLENCGIEDECKNNGYDPLASEDSCQHLQSTTFNSREKPLSDITGQKASSKIAEIRACLDHSACPPVFKENQGALLSGLNIKHGMECLRAASPCMAELERDTCEIDRTFLNGGQNYGIASECHEDNKTIHEAINLVGCQPVAPALRDEPKNEPEKSGDCIDSSMDAGSEELMQKTSKKSDHTPREACNVHDVGPSSQVANVTMDYSDNTYESDVNQDDKIPVVGAESTAWIHADNDSQFEDGEFREADAKYCWDESKDEDGELELVDYGSEFEEEMPCGADNIKEQIVERGSIPLSSDISRKIYHCGKTDALKDESTSSETRTSDITTESDVPSGVRGSRTSNRELQSWINDSDEIHGEDVSMRRRTRGGHHHVNPSEANWDLERRPPPHTYLGNYTPGTGKPKYMEGRGRTSAYRRDLETKGFTGFNNHVHRQFVNSSYEGGYEHATGTILTTNRNNATDGMHSTSPSGAISPISGRFRRYLQPFDRRFQGRHYRSSLEGNDEYPNHFSRRLDWRERSISPFNERQTDYAFTFKKSNSRSRSRSPASYFPARERIHDSWSCGRSPDFKSHARTGRVRLPFQKPFEAGYEKGFTSPTKGHSTLQHNNRLFGDRYGAQGNFKRKSPVRIIRQNQRSEWNSHDQFRPLKQSCKFTDNGGAVAIAGGEYRGSNDARNDKPSFDMVHRKRHYD